MTQQTSCHFSPTATTLVTRRGHSGHTNVVTVAILFCCVVMYYCIFKVGSRSPGLQWLAHEPGALKKDLLFIKKYAVLLKSAYIYTWRPFSLRNKHGVPINPANVNFRPIETQMWLWKICFYWICLAYHIVIWIINKVSSSFS